MPRRGSSSGSLDEARALIALVASLSEAGDALTPEAVSAKLGVSRERAERLIALVLTLAGIDGEGLPLVEEGDGVTLAFSRGVRGRRLRLTRSETVALVAALERLAVAKDDPLRSRLEASLATEPVDEGLVRRIVGEVADGVPGSAIACCAQALSLRQDLAFSYLKSGERESEARRAAPRRLRLEADLWYLDAVDLDRGGERTFRLDRMADVRAIERAGARVSVPRRTRRVTITFEDPRYLDLLPWHDLRIIERDAREEVVRAETGYYGGMWLPRMIAACAGTASCNDNEVNALVQDYARSFLAARENPATRATSATS